MIAKIKRKGREFYSYVFALMKDGGKSAAVVFDGEKDAFELVDVYESRYSIDRNIFVVDENTDDFVLADDLELDGFSVEYCDGCEWLVRNPQLLLKIVRGGDVDGKTKALARELNASIDLGGWRDVTDARSVAELIDVAGGFHDSFITGMEFEGSDRDPRSAAKLRVIFTLYGGEKLVLEFRGEIKIHYEFGTHINGIFAASVMFGEERVIFAEDVDEPDDIDEDTSFISADKLKWKILT